MAKVHYHKLNPIICDYEQLIPIGYNYNQLVIIIINLRLMTYHNLIGWNNIYGKVAHT